MPVRIQRARHLPEGGIAKRSIRETGRISTAFELFLLLSFASAVNLPLSSSFPALTRTRARAVQQKEASSRRRMAPASGGPQRCTGLEKFGDAWNNFGAFEGEGWLPNNPKRRLGAVAQLYFPREPLLESTAEARGRESATMPAEFFKRS
jgi:hypothetical protein